MKRSRRAVWIAAGLFTALCVGWLCYVPYLPDRVLAPIPAQASWVSLHRDPAERWDQVASNPVVANLLRGAGMDTPLPEELSARLFRLAGREVAVAYLPHLPPDGGSGWVVVSWIGARSHWLRWGLTLRPPDELEPRVWNASRPYWTVRHRGATGQRPQFSFALEEGLLIGCFSARPESMAMLLACFDGTAGSWLSLGDAHTAPLLRSASPDRAMFRSSTGPMNRLEIQNLSETRISLRMVWAGVPAGLAAAAGAEPDAMAARWFGDLPAGVAAVSAPALYAWAGAAGGAGLAEAASSLLSDPGMGTSVVAALFGGEFSGRLHGLRVPSATASIVIGDEVAAQRAAAVMLIRAGEALGIPLVPEPVPIDGVRVFGVGAPGHPGYGDLPPEERAAYAVVDGCLLVSSHLEPLMRLLQRRHWNPPPTSPIPPEGLWTTLHPLAPASFSCRLRETGQSLRNGLAVMRLNRLLHGGDAGLEPMDMARNAIVGLQELGMARGWIQVEPNECAIHVEIGPDEP